MAGIYIHIPFCKQACTYCNFHFSVSLKSKPTFVEALIKEIEINQSFINEKNIESIYFGGGTPSLLSIDELTSIFNAIQRKFIVAPFAEITIEANPDDINKKILKDWKSIGVNRLSVGLQSFNENELKWMNRAHSAFQSLQCIQDIKDAGYDNFSVDLIYGSPLQSIEDLKNNFDIIVSNNIPHISCYALTVEKGTVLNKLINENKSDDVDFEKQANQFNLLVDLMNGAGYEQYEISNFSKPNYRSIHNSNYWKSKPYFGFGPSAHSFNGKDTRRWNIANNGLYIQSLKHHLIPYEEEILTEMQSLNELVMISLRTVEGLNLSLVEINYTKLQSDRILKQAEKALAQKRIILSGKYLQLTNEGKFFADGIASDLFG